MIQEESGQHFDPTIVEALLEITAPSTKVA